MARVLTICGSGAEPGETDFITAYAQYADVLEAPRAMHEFVATELIATILNTNGVRISHGALSYPLDLWITLISGSGFGRSTLLSMANPVLEAARLEITRESHWGSAQTVYQEIANHPDGLFVWGEMSERLKRLNDRSFSGVKEWLTDRYDNFKAPDPITYRETGRKRRDTPPISFSCAPRINILASSSEEWFFDNMVEDDSMGGFLPRWIVVRPGESGRVVPTPAMLDESMINPLANRLGRIAELRGSADLSAILPAFETWYRAAKQRFDGQPNKGLANAFFNRHRVHVLKLAVTYEAASSLSLKVSLSAWRKAAQTAAGLETVIFSLLPTAMSKEGHAVSRMAERIRSAGSAGLPMSEFTRAFQHQGKKERDSRLQTLLEGERVSTFSRSTAGRPVNLLVHTDFVQKYRELHPPCQHG